MKKLNVNDPQVAEISEDWSKFLEYVYEDLPATATTMSLGQVLMFLLQEYKPPVEEFVQVLEVVMTVYAANIPDNRMLN